MTVNPYVTPEYLENTAPSAPPAEVKSSQKRKTNWFTMTGAIVGLVIGFATATYPTQELAAGFEEGRAYGRVEGHAIVCMMLGGGGCWFVWLLFTKPIKALIIAGVCVGLIAIVIANRASG